MGSIDQLINNAGDKGLERMMEINMSLEEPGVTWPYRQCKDRQTVKHTHSKPSGQKIDHFV